MPGPIDFMHTLIEQKNRNQSEKVHQPRLVKILPGTNISKDYLGLLQRIIIVPWFRQSALFNQYCPPMVVWLAKITCKDLLHSGHSLSFVKSGTCSLAVELPMTVRKFCTSSVARAMNSSNSQEFLAMAQVLLSTRNKAEFGAKGNKMGIFLKLRSLYLITSVFVGAFGLADVAQSMIILGDTNSSSPTAIFSLAFTGAGFSPDVPVGPGWISIDLGTFTLSRCPTSSCNESYGTQDGDFNDFILKIAFTAPNVLGSPAQIGADIFGTFGREGLSDEIKNGSSVTIDFDNSVHTLNYNGGPGGSFGHFDIYVDDFAPFGPYNNSGSKFSDENLTRQIVGHIGNLTQEFASSVPEPSSLLMLFAGLLAVLWTRSGKASKN